MHITAIIVAAGSGVRLKSLTRSVSKAFLRLHGRPLVYYSVKALEDFPLVAKIIMVVRRRDEALARALVKKYRFKKVARIVRGGPVRALSVKNGIAASSSAEKYILIHDAARPFITAALLRRVARCAERHSCVVPAVQVTSTVKEVSRNKVRRTVARRGLYEIQTPQIVARRVLQRAYKELAKRDIIRATDEAMLAERLGVKVYVAEGDHANIKFTVPHDFAYAEFLMRDIR